MRVKKGNKPNKNNHVITMVDIDQPLVIICKFRMLRHKMYIQIYLCVSYKCVYLTIVKMLWSQNMDVYLQETYCIVFPHEFKLFSFIVTLIIYKETVME